MNTDKILKGFGITPSAINKLIATVDAGLTQGVGDPKPGKMCVEAAVCYALGQEHGDEPVCVADEFRSMKITINDEWKWKNNKDRARGLRRLAIVQLGTSNKSFYIQDVFYEVREGVKADLFAGKFAQLSKAARINLMEAVFNNNDFNSESDVQDIYPNPHVACEKIVQACVRLKLPAVKYLKKVPYAPPKGTPAL